MILMLRIHFFVINVIALLSFPLTYVFLSSYEVIMRTTLLCLFINNFLFLVVALSRIKIKKSYLLLVFFMLLNFALGLANNDLSARLIVDELNIFMFFFKVIAVAYLCQSEQFFSMVLKYLGYYVVCSIVAAVIGTFFFYTLPQNAGAYVGLTPVAIPFLIVSMIKGHAFFFVFALLVIFLSGKRAMLLSSLIVIFLYALKSKKSRLLKFSIPFLFVVPVVLVYVPSDLLSGSFGKIERTVHALGSLDDDILLQLVGPRYFEITSIVQDMNPSDYVFGKGGGYTYDLVVGGEVLEVDHANAHFSYLALVSKYGFVLFFCLGCFFYRALISNGADRNTRLFLKLYLVSFMFESMFSYLIFNDRILHFVIGVLLVRVGRVRKYNV